MRSPQSNGFLYLLQLPVIVLVLRLRQLTLRFGSLHLEKMIVPKDSKQAAEKPPSYHSGSGSFEENISDSKAPNVPEQRYRQSISDSMLVLILRQPASDKPRFRSSTVTLHTVWLPQGHIRFVSNHAQNYPWPVVHLR